MNVKLCWAIVVCCLVLFPSLGCKEDPKQDEPIIEEPNEPEVPVDHAPLEAFIDECAASNDYLSNIALANSEFTLTSNSNKKLSIAKGSVPYLSVADDGLWEVDGVKTNVASGYPEIRHSVPVVALGTDSELTVDGKGLGVKAGKNLYCIINTKKNLHCYYENRTQTLGNEMYAMYNPELPKDAKTLNVLTIGNSFSVDATQHLAPMVDAIGVSNINIYRLYYPGYTLPEYLENFEKDNTCALSYLRYKDGAADWAGYLTKYDDNPETVFKKMQWDVIVIQGHTGREHTWKWGDGLLKNTVDALVKKFHALQPGKRPTVVYLLSQSYATGHEMLVSEFGNDRTKMFNATVDVAKRMMEETGVDYVISTGAAQENLRTTSLNNDVDLSRGDLYHLDYGIGRYVACCTLWETLFTQCLGYKLEDNTFRDDRLDTAATGRRTPITDQSAAIAQKAAHAAVQKPFEITNLSSL